MRVPDLERVDGSSHRIDRDSVVHQIGNGGIECIGTAHDDRWLALSVGKAAKLMKLRSGRSGVPGFRVFPPQVDTKKSLLDLSTGST